MFAECKCSWYLVMSNVLHTGCSHLCIRYAAIYKIHYINYIFQCKFQVSTGLLRMKLFICKSICKYSLPLSLYWTISFYCRINFKIFLYYCFHCFNKVTYISVCKCQKILTVTLYCRIHFKFHTSCL